LRQFSAAVAAELPRQHHFLAVPAGADNVRAEFATAAIVAADHLLLPQDRFAE
jgi:hypothetical protein